MAPCPGGKLAQAECFVSIRKTTILGINGWIKGVRAECKLHPLIHTLPKFNLTQDVEKKKAEPLTPHFLSCW
jgi:hypothetical protein